MQSRKRRWNPTHLWKSPHGTYFFRFVVPPALRSQYPGLPREIRRSLKTDSWRTAIVAARAFRVELDKSSVNYPMKQQTHQMGAGIFACYMGLKLPLADGRQVEVSIERDTPEEEARAANEFLAHWQPDRVPAPTAPSVLPTVARHPFKSLADAYIQHKHETGAIDDKTKGQYQASLGLVAGIIGDKDAREIDWTDADRLLKGLRRYPSNAAKRFPGKTASQLLQMADASPFLGVGTINSLLTRASAMCKWAVRRQLLDRNPFEDMERSSNRRQRKPL